MNALIEGVRKSIETQNWYAALITSLTLPDICGYLQYPSKQVGLRYIEWFNTYLAQEYFMFLTGEDCYALRCSYLHEGSDNITGQPKKNILDYFIFTTTPTHKNYHEQFGTAFLLLNVEQFCKDICAGVEKWLQDVTSNSQVQNNMSKLINIRDSMDEVFLACSVTVTVLDSVTSTP